MGLLHRHLAELQRRPAATARAALEIADRADVAPVVDLVQFAFNDAVDVDDLKKLIIISIKQLLCFIILVNIIINKSL